MRTKIALAALIWLADSNVSDEEAYRIIREQAMSKRTATEDIARAIIQADGVLSYTSGASR